MKVAVAGGTGVVGRQVVARLREVGHEAVVLARSTGVDVTSGTGLSAALAGAEAVIDVTSVATTRASVARAFFDTATRRLLAAGADADVGHHVALSIVNCDRVELGYYVGKRAQEALVLGPQAQGRGSVLRATQFHEFAGQMLARSRGPLAPVPKMRTQPIAAREVAAALVDLAAGPPAGLVQDLAGPATYELPDMARQVLAAQGRRRRVLAFRLPGAVGRQLTAGELLPSGPARFGTLPFEQWLTSSDGPAPATPGRDARGETRGR